MVIRCSVLHGSEAGKPTCVLRHDQKDGDTGISGTHSDLPGLSSESRLPEQDASGYRDGRTSHGTETGEEIVHHPAKYPQYTFPDQRRESFKNWPRDAYEDIDALVNAGLFYQGKKDKTTCFYCGGALCKWVPSDNPAVEHLRWYPNCEYIRLRVSPRDRQEIQDQQRSCLTTEADEGESDAAIDELIRRVVDADSTEFYRAFDIDEKILRKAVRHLLQKGVPLTDITEMSQIEIALREVTALPKTDVQEPKSQNPGLQQSACTICYDEPKSVLFLPCQHLASCVNCSPAIQVCPICRTPIEQCIRAFLC